jgi:hypothetical protein
MKKVFKEGLNIDGFTPGKTYRVHYISTQKVGSYSVESYQILNDYGKKVEMVSRFFRDFNKQELRQQKFKLLGI